MERPWQVTDVELRLAAGEVEVRVEHSAIEEDDMPYVRGAGTAPRQPSSPLATRAGRASTRPSWRAGPWYEPGSGITGLFEVLVIDWLREASIQAVARRLDLF